MDKSIESSKPTKAVILARVSSREQETEGYSLSAQERLLLEYCKRTDLAVNRVFQISETASKSQQRLIFNSMLEYVDQQKVKILVCEKVDRFVRNFKDTVVADDWLEADDQRRIHFVKDSLVLHRHSRSQEKLNWGMRVVIAKNYIDNLKEEVAKGQKEKLLQGWLPVKPPLGYKTALDGRHSIQVVNRAVSPLIKLLYELYDSGSYSVSMLTDEIKNQGLRTMYGRPPGKSQVYRILTNPYYYGLIKWKDEEYDGKHEPIITQALFERVRTRLRRPNPPKYSKHNPLFKGLIVCTECHGIVTWELQRGHWYGHCNRYRGCSKKKFIRSEEVERQMLEYFEALVCPSPAIVAWVKKELLANHNDTTEVRELSLTQLNQRLQQLRGKADRLYDDKLEEAITKERYKQKLQEIRLEQSKIAESIEKLNQVDDSYINRGIKIIELTQQVASTYMSKDDILEKRALLSHIFSSIGLNGQTLDCEYRKEAFVVLEKVEKTKALEKTFERIKNPSVEQKEALIVASRSVWLGR